MNYVQVRPRVGRWLTMAMLAILLACAGVFVQGAAAEAHTVNTGARSCPPDSTVRISGFVYSTGVIGIDYLLPGASAWTIGNSWSTGTGYYTVYYDTGARSIANGTVITSGEVVSVGTSCI